ncbi:MAG TPA: GNAT family N-acetyltransferase [Natronosporangium sp.]|nr:GNAT family N-acetyltransferase [Natronosporangium sp.]
MGAVEVVQVDPQDQRMVDQWLAVRQAAQEADAPHLPSVAPAPHIVGLLRHRSDRRVEQWVARRDGEVVAAAELQFHLRDNRHLVEVDLVVSPQWRRQGIGTALVRHVERRAVAQGRDTLVAYVVDPIAGGPPRPRHGQRFAASHGYVRVLDEVHRVADLTAVPEADLDRLLAGAWRRAAGYELVQWAGRMPEEIVDGVAYLDSRMLVDSPTGELDLEQAVVDADRMREVEAYSRATGMLELGTAVRHRGEVAGYTAIEVIPGDEEHCWQGNTIVDPRHRGRRLGTVLKVENHRLLRSYRPRMRFVHTWNAEVNQHMIAINEALGYRAVDRWIAYQKKLSP